MRTNKQKGIVYVWKRCLKINIHLSIHTYPAPQHHSLCWSHAFQNNLEREIYDIFCLCSYSFVRLCSFPFLAVCFFVFLGYSFPSRSKHNLKWTTEENEREGVSVTARVKINLYFFESLRQRKRWFTIELD